jgi:hypothetical protein
MKTSAALTPSLKKGHYKPIAKRFCHDHFTFRQIAREGDLAIYEQTWNGCENPSVAYEVVRIRRQEGKWIKDKFLPAREIYPTSRKWGLDGFTLTDKERAFAKLKFLKGGDFVEEKESTEKGRQRPDETG